jgi:hypothetical protein
MNKPQSGLKGLGKCRCDQLSITRYVITEGIDSEYFPKFSVILKAGRNLRLPKDLLPPWCQLQIIFMLSALPGL